VLFDAARNHLSWFGRRRARIDLDGVTVFIGQRDAVLAVPQRRVDLSEAVELARKSGASEIGCWALAPDEVAGDQLWALGFQDGWAPHWLGVDPRERLEEPAHVIEETSECDPALPYSSEGHGRARGVGVHHFVVRENGTIVGHSVLNIERESGGIYDMGVLPEARRRGYGRALTLAALARARQAGCTSVTLNATAEGELLYRSIGFRSFGHGMTWWLFPARAR
jgi:GNAT superfamily N-acetyltransferase